MNRLRWISPSKNQAHFNILDQRLANYCCKGPESKCLRFGELFLSFLAVIQLCQCSAKVVPDYNMPVTVIICKCLWLCWIKLYLQKQTMGCVWPTGHSLPIPVLDNNYEWHLSSENCKVPLKVLTGLMSTCTVFTLRADPDLGQKDSARPADSTFTSRAADQHGQKLTGTQKCLFLLQCRQLFLLWLILAW